MAECSLTYQNYCMRINGNIQYNTCGMMMKLSAQYISMLTENKVISREVWLALEYHEAEGQAKPDQFEWDITGVFWDHGFLLYTTDTFHHHPFLWYIQVIYPTHHIPLKMQHMWYNSILWILSNTQSIDEPRFNGR